MGLIGIWSSLWSSLFARPLARTIDLASPAVAVDPFPHYERLRRDGSVQRLARHEAWIVLGYEDVQAAFLQPDAFSSRPYAEIDGVLLAADPPAHTDIRRIVSRYFTPRLIDELAAFAETHARTLLKPRLDIVSEYAHAISSAVAARLLGVTEKDHADIQSVRGSSAAIPDFAAFLARLGSVAAHSAVYERLRRDGLDADDARSLFRLLWLAATATTERSIARCVLYLLLHEEARRPEVVEPFVEEVLRLHPPELLVARVTTRRVTLGGTTIPAESAVYLALAAANRDPAKFREPSRMLLDRPPTRTFTFGSGIHQCVGATLGRRVLRASVRALLPCAASLRPAHPLTDLVRWCNKTSSPIARLVVEGAA